METPAAPRSSAAAAALPPSLPPFTDEEVPLGWECAAPALQIEHWGVDDPPLSGKS